MMTVAVNINNNSHPHRYHREEAKLLSVPLLSDNLTASVISSNAKQHCDVDDEILVMRIGDDGRTGGGYCPDEDDDSVGKVTHYQRRHGVAVISSARAISPHDGDRDLNRLKLNISKDHQSQDKSCKATANTDHFLRDIIDGNSDDTSLYCYCETVNSIAGGGGGGGDSNDRGSSCKLAIAATTTKNGRHKKHITTTATTTTTSGVTVIEESNNSGNYDTFSSKPWSSSGRKAVKGHEEKHTSSRRIKKDDDSTTTVASAFTATALGESGQKITTANNKLLIDEQSKQGGLLQFQSSSTSSTACVNQQPTKQRLDIGVDEHTSTLLDGHSCQQHQTTRNSFHQRFDSNNNSQAAVDCLHCFTNYYNNGPLLLDKTMAMSDDRSSTQQLNSNKNGNNQNLSFKQRSPFNPHHNKNNDSSLASSLPSTRASPGSSFLTCLPRRFRRKLVNFFSSPPSSSLSGGSSSCGSCCCRQHPSGGGSSNNSSRFFAICVTIYVVNLLFFFAAIAIYTSLSSQLQSQAAGSDAMAILAASFSSKNNNDNANSHPHVMVAMKRHGDYNQAIVIDAEGGDDDDDVNSRRAAATARHKKEFMNRRIQVGKLPLWYNQTGYVLLGNSDFFKFSSRVSTSLVYRAPLEDRVKRMFPDETGENKLVALAPAITFTDGRVRLFQRLWMSQNEKAHLTSKPTLNTFNENYLLSRSLTPDYEPIDRTELVPLPVTTNCVTAFTYRTDGPMDARVFTINGTTYLSFHMWHIDPEFKLPRSRIFLWNEETRQMSKLKIANFTMLWTEINWVPLVVNGSLYFTYSFDPLRVVHCPDLSGHPIIWCRMVYEASKSPKYVFNEWIDAFRGGGPWVHYQGPYFISFAHTHHQYIKEELNNETFIEGGIYSGNMAVLKVVPASDNNGDGELSFRLVYVSEPLLFNKKLLLSGDITRNQIINWPFAFPVGSILWNGDVADIGVHINDSRGYVVRLTGLLALMRRIIDADQRNVMQGNGLDESSLAAQPDIGLVHKLARESLVRLRNYETTEFFP